MSEDQLKIVAMTIESVRRDVNQRLDELATQVNCLLPETKPVDPVTDWKGEVESW